MCTFIMSQPKHENAEAFVFTQSCDCCYNFRTRQKKCFLSVFGDGERKTIIWNIWKIACFHCTWRQINVAKSKHGGSMYYDCGVCSVHWIIPYLSLSIFVYDRLHTIFTELVKLTKNIILRNSLRYMHTTISCFQTKVHAKI